MNDSGDAVDKTIVGLMVVMFLFGWTKCSFELQKTIQKENWRTKIVEHGCGEFYLDKKHVRQWRWKAK